MKPLPRPERPQLILSFDFDGTLHDPASDPTVDREFHTMIETLREERGAIWGINTGRSMNHVIEGLMDGQFRFCPDWVVAREREIWYPNTFGRWLADAKWNKMCEKEHRRFFRKVRKVLKAIRDEVEEQTGARWIEQDGDPAGIVAESEEEMDWIVKRTRELAVSEPLLGWQRNSIYLRFGHRQYQKGSTLRQVAEGFGLRADACLAVGDSHNDFEMLAPDSAGMIACPGNAKPEIQAHVTANRGYVCKETCSRGCLEAMRYFLG